jgi:aspartyl-tRNA(Asn)/glutamyl-tRNA(Gln) amidotransferase subunit A
MLSRIGSLEPKLNAYITVTAREALEAARQCDAELARGQDRGPLHGIPLAVKDLYDTAGIRTTSGSKIQADRVPEEDAASIARLRGAGAIIVGKTNLNEFACGVTTTNAHYGDTYNPWDLGRTPGGSSGGSGAALAAGLCTIATGTDTGGSIRIPAAFCGIVGLKPTYGRISVRGIMPLSWEQDHPGPMARTVFDAALMLEAMAGWDAADPVSARQPVPRYTAELDGNIKGWRIGVDRQLLQRSPMGQGIITEVRRAIEAALDVLAGLGAEVVEVRLPDLEEGLQAGLGIWGAEALAVHAEGLRAQPDAYDPLVRTRLEKGFAITGLEYARAQRKRREIMRDLETLFEQVRLIVTPTCATGAPPHGAKSVVIEGQEIDVLAGATRFSRAFNLTGSPAMSVPCGFTADGLPIGLQLVGGMFDEVALLKAGHAYEQATEWHLRRPPLA